LAMTSLSKNTGAMNTALNRLSTGYRINSSKDDAAGSAISASLEKEISSFEVAQDNAQMGQSMIDVATNTLNNLQGMVQRIRDLAEESANGTYGYEERRAMQNEVNSLVDEIYRIKETTVFNGKKIFGEESSRIESPKALSEAEAIAQGYTVVKTAQELKDALVSDDPNCKVMLFSNINLNDLELDETSSNWTAVENFKGILDGNDFTISNLTINRRFDEDQGLIGLASGATIKNFELKNAYVKGNSGGCLVGEASNKTTLENCNVSGDISGALYVGGIAGYNSNSSIKNCNFSGTVDGNNNYTGGITGRNAGATAKIENCTVDASIYCYQNAGGIVGYNIANATVENCTASGSVEGSSNIGGIVGGHMTGTINNSKSTNTVTGTNNVGGIAGGNRAKVNNSKTTSIINGEGSTGAAIGSCSGTKYSLIRK